MSYHPELDTQAEEMLERKSSPLLENETKGKPVSDREKLLRKAAQIIEGHRDEEYGSPEDSFRAIANHWTEYLVQRCGLAEKLSAGDVAVMMVLLKVARMETGGLKQTDSWLDIAGYAACGFETQHLDAP